MNFIRLIGPNGLECLIIDVQDRQRLFHYFLFIRSFILWVLCLAGCQQDTTAVQQSLAAGRQVSGPRVGIIGSDTLSPLLHVWGQVLQEMAPAIVLHVQASGSATAPIALASGHAMIGPMSRPINDFERKVIQQKLGFPPLKWPLALDALAFYVHPINPITDLSRQEIERLFAKVPLCYAATPIGSWGEIPRLSYLLSRVSVKNKLTHTKENHDVKIIRHRQLLQQLAQSPPRLIGRNSLSGTYHSVRKHLLCGGMFNTSMSELPSAIAIIHAISQQPTAIGFASLRAQLNTVKVLSIGGVFPNIQAIRQQRYPWIRTVYLYVATQPNHPMPPTLWTTLSWIYAEVGQRVLSDLGFIPLSEDRLTFVRQQLMNKKPQTVIDRFNLADTLLTKDRM